MKLHTISEQQIKLGVNQLLEAVGAGDHELQGVDDAGEHELQSIASAPIPDVEKKGLVHRFWDKYKTMIKYGALGAAAVGLLLWAGISWQSLLPSVGMGVLQTAMGRAAGEMIDPEPQTASNGIEARVDGYEDYYIKQNGEWVRSSHEEIADMAAQSPEQRIKIHRAPSSRPSAEHRLDQSLSDRGIRGTDVEWLPNVPGLGMESRASRSKSLSEKLDRILESP